MLSLDQAKPKSPFARNRQLRDALGQALYDAMTEDAAIHLFGEGCEAKVHYDAPEIERGFLPRCHTMPISEDGNLNFAVGASLLGVKPVIDVISADFLYRCMDSLCNTAAKLDFVTELPHTIVVRAEFLLGGPTTGQRPEAMFTHVPGLRVAIPSTPRDAYGLMRTALDGPGVSLILEDRMVEDGVWESDDTVVSGERVPFGQCRFRRGGLRNGPLVLTYGVTRQVVERALAGLGPPRIIDLRSLYPLDWEKLDWCMSRHFRVFVVEPDVTYGGIGAEIVAQLAERFPFTEFRRLGAPREIVPAAKARHAEALPTEKDVLNALYPL